MTEVVTVGWLTVDDIVLVDGTCRKDVLGGGALYSAVGASIFADEVAIHSVCGKNYADRARAEIAARGIDPSGIAAIDGRGLELWLLHESETHKQQIPKIGSSTAAEMDRHRGPVGATHRSARAFHIAPQSPAGSIANARDLAALQQGPIVTMDILSDVFIDKSIYADLSFLDYLDAFLPSESEILRIWGAQSVADFIHEAARRHVCHVIAKLGEEGSLVAEAGSGRLIHVPALEVEAVDTTGAGDGYCGGFVAGLGVGRPLEVAAAMGTVAASYVVEASGALLTARPLAAERDHRLAAALAGARSYSS